MATFRVIWEFLENTGAQFNEVYYTDASNAAEASQTTNALVSKRVAFLHPNNKLLQIRSSQVDASRVTAVTVYNYPGTAPGSVVAGTVGGQATAGDSIVCTLSGVGGGSRKIWCRGAPDDYILRNRDSGVDAPPSILLNALTTWFKALQANGYGLRRVATQVPGPLANLKILQVDGTARDGTSLVTLSAAPGYPFPSRVIIGGASKKDLPALNGRWSLINAPALAVIHIPYQTPEGTIVIGGNGKCRQEQFQPINVFSAANCSFAYYRTRTTKNPITHSRGARRAVRIRTSL